LTPEERLQIRVARLLDGLAPFWRFQWFHVPNESRVKLSVGLLAKWKRMGVKAGNPDCHIIKEGGKCFQIELKVKNRKQSSKQEDWEDSCKKLGINYYLCRSVDEVAEVMRREFSLKKGVNHGESD